MLLAAWPQGAPQFNVSSCAPAHNAPLPLRRSPPVSCKHMSGRTSLLTATGRVASKRSPHLPQDSAHMSSRYRRPHLGGSRPGNECHPARGRDYTRLAHRHRTSRDPSSQAARGRTSTGASTARYRDPATQRRRQRIHAVGGDQTVQTRSYRPRERSHAEWPAKGSRRCRKRPLPHAAATTTAHPCCGWESDSTDAVVSAERTVARRVARQRIATLSQTAAAPRCVADGGEMAEGSWAL